MTLDGRSVATELQAALEANQGLEPRIVHDHGSEFVNRDVAAVIKAYNLIDVKTRPRHPESNGIVERFNGTVRDETDNDYGRNYLRAEAIVAKLMQHYNEERLHARLGYMTPATWHRGKPQEVREARAANRCGPCTPENDQSAAFYRGGLAGEVSFVSSAVCPVDVKRDIGTLNVTSSGFSKMGFEGRCRTSVEPCSAGLPTRNL
jgi:Integrase core domain